MRLDQKLSGDKNEAFLCKLRMDGQGRRWRCCFTGSTLSACDGLDRRGRPGRRRKTFLTGQRAHAPFPATRNDGTGGVWWGRGSQGEREERCSCILSVLSTHPAVAVFFPPSSKGKASTVHLFQQQRCLAKSIFTHAPQLWTFLDISRWAVREDACAAINWAESQTVKCSKSMKWPIALPRCELMLFCRSMAHLQFPLADGLNASSYGVSETAHQSQPVLF